MVKQQSRRNHQFDLLRILFATLVLLAHAFELTEGKASHELLNRWTRSSMTFGTLGVDGFFVLSGYLIVQSWLGDPDFVQFMRKRLLRIVPGFLIAVIVSTLAVGLLAPGVDRFFSHIGWSFLKSIVLLTVPDTPPVLPGMPFPTVNGAMYTIAYEFRCYLFVALLGLCGLLRRPALCLAANLLLLSSLLSMAPLERIRWPWLNVFGLPALTIRLTGIYLVGVTFFLLREKIAFRPYLAMTATAAMVAWVVFLPSRAEFAVVVCGSYLMFYLGQMHLSSLSWMNHFPDISYGIYLYGWPVESLWIWFHRGSPWICFFVSTIVCFALGWMSWHFVERPALTLKRRTTVPLPVA